MSTPLFDKLYADWTNSTKATEARVRLENRKLELEVLALLKTFKRPTVAVKEMIERLEK